MLSSGYIMFQNPSQRRIKLVSEPYLWLIIFCQSCTQFIFLIIWSFLLWRVHTEGDLIFSITIRYPQSQCSRLRITYYREEDTLMQTWYWRSIQDFFCIQTRYSEFHCSLLIIPFCLAEFPNICISCWLFGSSVGWRTTLIGKNFVTPKAQRKEQKKRLKQKHTSILLI